MIFVRIEFNNRMCKKFGILLGKHPKTILYRHYSVKADINIFDLPFLNIHQKKSSKDLRKKSNRGLEKPKCSSARDVGYNGQMKRDDRFKIIDTGF